MPSQPAPPDPPVRVISLHGRDLCYVFDGSGPPVVLLHGVTSSSRSWARLVDELADDFTVVAPDLFGHGQSDKALGDYSLGAHAAALRDLMDLLGLGRVTLVGHSLGGGIAMQFAYLFPERVERLVLVASGGLGREVSLLLRAPTLPGAEWVLPVVASSWVRRYGEALGRAARRVGVEGGPDAAEAWQGFVSLGDADARRAFLATIRGVVDPGGQTVTARDRLHLMESVPTLLVWGERDRLIPVQHAIAAHEAIQGSRLEIFPRAGHFPHLYDPDRFARVLREFCGLAPSRQRPA